MRLWHMLRRAGARSLLPRPARGGSAARSCSSTSTAKPNACGRSGMPRRRRGSRRCPHVRRRRADQGGVPRRARHGGDRRACARHPPRRPAPRPRLALHGRRRPHPRPRHRRQYRDLQPDQRDALPRAVVRRSRSPRRHLSERHQRRRLDGNSYPAYLDMAAYTDVFASTTAALVPLGVNYLDRGRPAAGGRRAHDAPPICPCWDCEPSLGRWFNAAEDTPGAAVVAVVGHAGVDEEVPRGSVGDRPHHPDRRRAGHDRGGRPRGPPRHDQHRPRHRLLAADLVAAGARRAAAQRSSGVRRKPAFFVKARLRDGVTVAQAQAAMRILGTRLAAEYPKEDPGKGIAVFASSDVRIHPQMDGLLHAVAVGAARSSSGSCWRSRAATWRRCCSCAAPPARRKCRFGWPWARRAGSSFVTC